MVTTKLMWLATATVAAASVALSGCGAEGEDIEGIEDGGTGGTRTGSGGTGAIGTGTGGQFNLQTGGSESGARDNGVVVGTLRDLPFVFPDYTPRFDPTIDPAMNPIQGKLQSPDPATGQHDTAIVGALGSPLGDDGKPIYAGDPVNGTATTWGTAHPLCDQPCFHYWYRTVEGINQEMQYELQLVEDPTRPGTWVFDNNGQMWFPIDNQMFGNDDPKNPEHNYGFTFELAIEFQYQEGQVFQFIGDDDVFVYINGELAVNLGGIHGKLGGPPENIGMVQLDTLNLIPGENYMLHFFFAERNPTFSNFRIETTIAPDDWVVPH